MNTLHQQIMDQAYDKWSDDKHWTKAMFWDHLNYQEKVAISLGTLNYQIGNGGFVQWYDNDYYKHHMKFLLGFFRELEYSKCSSNMKQIHQILLDVDDYVKHHNENEITYASKFINKCDDAYCNIEEKEVLTEFNNFVKES